MVSCYNDTIQISLGKESGKFDGILRCSNEFWQPWNQSFALKPQLSQLSQKSGWNGITKIKLWPFPHFMNLFIMFSFCRWICSISVVLSISLWVARHLTSSHVGAAISTLPSGDQRWSHPHTQLPLPRITARRAGPRLLANEQHQLCAEHQQDMPSAGQGCRRTLPQDTCQRWLQGKDPAVVGRGYFIHW